MLYVRDLNVVINQLKAVFFSLDFLTVGSFFNSRAALLHYEF